MNRNMIRGFTLIEVMITAVIFSLIMGVLASAFVLNTRIHSSFSKSSELAQNGRIVLERMGREIRQAKEIVTELSQVEASSSPEIVFHDGHTSSVFEEGVVQTATTETITLAVSASNTTYDGLFIKITEGIGSGQIQKIKHYNGDTNVAEIEGVWTTVPIFGSKYVIDSQTYYTRYFINGSDLRRQMFVYYLDANPDRYVTWDDEDLLGTGPGGPNMCVLSDCPTCPTTCLILEDQLIGEYFSTLNFWGLQNINLSVELEKGGVVKKFRTKVFGRNL